MEWFMVQLQRALLLPRRRPRLTMDVGYQDGTISSNMGLKRRDDEDKDKEPSAGSNQGSKRRRARTEPEFNPEEPMHTTKDLEEPVYQEFKIGVTKDQPNEETSQFPVWFQRPTKLPSLYRYCNKTLPNAHGPVQPWLTFMMNRLKVDTLTPEVLTGPTFELMKGSCKSLVELEYLLRRREFAQDVTSNLNHCLSQSLEIVGLITTSICLITVRRDDDKLYKFKKGDLNRLRIQDIEDMLLLLV
ncbi:hypothetical protein Tco_0373397 [Tanacetum coccineum]